MTWLQRQIGAASPGAKGVSGWAREEKFWAPGHYVLGLRVRASAQQRTAMSQGGCGVAYGQRYKPAAR
jgi:hypothetical protein